MLATGIRTIAPLSQQLPGEILNFGPQISPLKAPLIHLDDITIDLFDLGFVAHTEGDVLAWLPDNGVLFAGDLIFHGGTPFALFGSVQGTLDALDVIERREAEVIVPGHGPAFSGSQIKDVLDSQRTYLNFVQQTAEEGIAAGRTPVEQPHKPT